MVELVDGHLPAGVGSVSTLAEAGHTINPQGIAITSTGGRRRCWSGSCTAQPGRHAGRRG